MSSKERNALRWLVNLGYGVGKAGGKPESGEFEAAIDAGKAALSEAEPGEPFAWVDMQTKSDCLLACIASLTGLTVGELPQPPTQYEDLVRGGEPTSADRDAEAEYGAAVKRYLRDNGWWVQETWKFVPAGYALASGPSPRNPRIWHTVVHCDGKLVHDPHPSRAGIEEVELYEVLLPAVGDAALRVNPKVANDLRNIVAGVSMGPDARGILLTLADDIELDAKIIRPKQVAEQGADNESS